MPQPDGCGIRLLEKPRVMHKDHTEEMFVLPYKQPHRNKKKEDAEASSFQQRISPR